jgi:hypothetical protein
MREVVPCEVFCADLGSAVISFPGVAAVQMKVACYTVSNAVDLSDRGYECAMVQ